MRLALEKKVEGETPILKKEIDRILSEELQKQLLLEPINPLIGMPGKCSTNLLVQFIIYVTFTAVDIHLDTPTEILHTVLLGVVKYFWGQTITLVTAAKALSLFETRLASFSINGLNSAKISAEYMCHYKGGLIGKHFKSLAQIMSFLVYDLVPATVLNAWNSIGELVVLLWHTEIIDTEVYLVGDSFLFGIFSRADISSGRVVASN